MRFRLLVLTFAAGVLVGCGSTGGAESVADETLELTRAVPNPASPESPCGWIYAFNRQSGSRDACVYIWPTQEWTLAEETSPGHFSDELARGAIVHSVAVDFPIAVLKDSRRLFTAGQVEAVLDGDLIRRHGE